MFAKQIAMQRQDVIKYLMPDVCQIYPKNQTGMTINSAGITVRGTQVAREWKSSTDIPCRADLSRAFRPDKLKNQTTEVNEYNLELPYDMVVTADDRVVVRGRNFVIRKIKDASNWDVTIECVIEEISTDLD